jgi:hypothetical protein
MAAAAAPGADFDVRELIDGAALLASTANVVMQLAQLPVGHGVLESTVESRQVMRHPSGVRPGEPVPDGRVPGTAVP